MNALGHRLVDSPYRAPLITPGATEEGGFDDARFARFAAYGEGRATLTLDDLAAAIAGGVAPRGSWEGPFEAACDLGRLVHELGYVGADRAPRVEIEVARRWYRDGRTPPGNSSRPRVGFLSTLARLLYRLARGAHRPLAALSARDALVPARRAPRRLRPVVIDLGKADRKQIEALQRGKGPLCREVDQAVAQASAGLSAVVIQPVVIVYRKRSRRLF